jgi:hypothetical protein
VLKGNRALKERRAEEVKMEKEDKKVPKVRRVILVLLGHRDLKALRVAEAYKVQLDKMERLVQLDKMERLVQLASKV